MCEFNDLEILKIEKYIRESLYENGLRKWRFFYLTRKLIYI